MMTTLLLRTAALAALVTFSARSARAVATDTLTLRTDRARYAPGQTVTLVAEVPARSAAAAAPAAARLRLFTPTGRVPGAEQRRKTRPLAAGRRVTFTWKATGPDFRGYRADVDLLDARGRVTATGSIGVDVSSDWRRFPRYGFLSRFDAGVAVNETLDAMNRFHLNAVQFYDWQWQHHRPYSPEATWPDIANRTIARSTVTSLIDGAHRRGMLAFHYNLVNGAYDGYTGDDSGVRPEWGLFKSVPAAAGKETPKLDAQDRHDGLPASWATQRLYLFNPADPGWQRYTFARQQEVFDAFPFDGWHIDSLGDRGTLYDARGGRVDLQATFAPFVGAARRALKKRMVFNPVGGYGMEPIARAGDTDILYTELWEWSGGKTYEDIRRQAESARERAPAHSLVFAAYLNKKYGEATPDGQQRRFRDASVRLADAAIFASGASHIEVGDGANLLCSEYFPNRKLAMSPALRTALTGYYDFLVAYENLLQDPAVRPDPLLRVAVEGTPASIDGRAGTVWARARRTAAPGGTTILHLINLTAAPSSDWRDTDAVSPDPKPLDKVKVRLYGVDVARFGPKAVLRVATPDADHGRWKVVPFTRGREGRGGGAYVAFTVPRVHYWTMAYLSRE